MSTNQAMQNCGVITIEQKDMVEGQAVSIFIETGLTPRELAEQREELLDALRECVTEPGAHCTETNIGHYERIRRMKRRIDAINDIGRAAITKATT